jgi:CO/xanthine dehydrogenase Mo-binding subunit
MREAFSATTLTRDQAEILEVPEVRLDGMLKTTGRARYMRDFVLPRMLWARFLMSPHAHARIVSIDTSAARALPGVQAVITADDIGRKHLGRQVADWPVLAYDRVRFVGDRIAAVAADTPEAADEAIKRIEVVYEELPAVFDAEAAIRPDAPIVHPDWESYYPQGRVPELTHPNAPSYATSRKGEEDIERIFANAHLVIEDVYFGPRQHQGYIEPRGCVVWIDEQGTVQVVTTNKTPFSLRDHLASISGLPSDRVVVDSRFIGGDFGGKGSSIEEFATYFLARATGRPVRTLLSYTDELCATNPQPEAKYYLRTAVNREGKMIAHDVRAFLNGGAYVAMRPNPPSQARQGLTCLGVYNVPNVRFEGYSVYTNLVPAGAMRAPGDFHRAQAGEVHVDHIAHEMGIDPLEFRLRNCLRPGDTMLSGGKIRNPMAVDVLEALRKESNWGQTPKLPNRGRGLALRFRHVGEAKSELLLRLAPNGSVEAITGHADQGGGAYNVIQRAVAATLTIPLDRVSVRYGTTAEALRDPGAGGSHTTAMNGHAAIDGSLTLRDKLEELAAEVMGWPAGQVRLEHDEFVVRQGDSTTILERAPFTEVASRIAAGPVVEAVGAYDPADHHSEDGADYNFIAHMIEVEVDPDSGHVRPIDVVTTADVGTIINPIAYQGQLDGGFVYGYGQAMTEELVHEEGTIITSSLAEYKLPTQMDIPPVRMIRIPAKIGPGPFGAKSVGENTNIGVGAAIANAVFDAVGVRVDTSPITSERVYAALQERAGGEPS